MARLVTAALGFLAGAEALAVGSSTAHTPARPAVSDSYSWAHSAVIREVDDDDMHSTPPLPRMELVDMQVCTRPKFAHARIFQNRARPKAPRRCLIKAGPRSLLNVAVLSCLQTLDMELYDLETQQAEQWLQSLESGMMLDGDADDVYGDADAFLSASAYIR